MQAKWPSYPCPGKGLVDTGVGAGYEGHLDLCLYLELECVNVDMSFMML